MKGQWIHRVPQSIAMLRDWRQHWGEPRRPTRDNCMCGIITEHQYGPRGYYWYGWMSLLQCACGFNPKPALQPPRGPLVYPAPRDIRPVHMHFAQGEHLQSNYGDAAA